MEDAEPPTTDGFAAATGVTPEGDGRYAARVAPGWDIAGNANGGYLLAIAARALADAARRPDPVTVSAHYLSPAQAGALTIATEVLKAGRRFTTARADLHAVDDTTVRPVLSAMATLGDLRDANGPELLDGGPPDLPPPEECGTMAPAGMFPPSFANRVEMRLHPEDATFAMGTKTGQARMRGWFRLPNDEPVDTLALLCAADAFPPTIFNVDLPVGWTPTIELTVHVRATPAPGWLRCQFATRFVTGGFLEEDGELWDETGRLVALSRQLALVPRG